MLFADSLAGCLSLWLGFWEPDVLGKPIPTGRDTLNWTPGDLVGNLAIGGGMGIRWGFLVAQGDLSLGSRFLTVIDTTSGNSTGLHQSLGAWGWLGAGVGGHWKLFSGAATLGYWGLTSKSQEELEDETEEWSYSAAYPGIGLSLRVPLVWISYIRSLRGRAYRLRVTLGISDLKLSTPNILGLFVEIAEDGPPTRTRTLSVGLRGGVGP